MKIEPLGDKVVVKRMDPSSRTSGGIIIPDAAKEKPQQGKILAVGPGKLVSNGSRQAMQVAEGDRVLFSSYAGTEIEVNGEDVLILGETEILAVLA